MRANFHHGTVVRPSMESSPYGYSEQPPLSYAAPPAARYTYAPGSTPSSLHHADYQTYYVGPDRPRCSCGDRTCDQFSVPDIYPCQSSAAQYYGTHVGPPPGPPAALYPAGRRMVYPGEHFQIIGPPSATHCHHHRYHYPPPSSAAAHFVPAFHADGLGAAPRQTMAPAAGCSEDVTTTTTTTSSTPLTRDVSAAAQMNSVDTASSASNVTQDITDASESSTAPCGTSTTSITAEHDITPTRDTTATNSTQWHAYSSGNIFTG